ncbi:hypothetical protein ABZX30_12345 [Streptomyces sp. NPDC004542]|uniref:hypothetical protein n=1 Tax=Streptomyces sp. NPDC004542 TaxID=3154281 RepID=UPI0033AB3B50
MRLTPPGTDDGRGTAPAGFRVTAHRAGGAYSSGLSWVPPRTDGVVTEYRIRLEGRPATSLVRDGSQPRTRAASSYCAGRDAGMVHRVRIRTRLPDGTGGGYSAARTATTGGTGRAGRAQPRISPGCGSPSPGRVRSACGTARAHVC